MWFYDDQVNSWIAAVVRRWLVTSVPDRLNITDAVMEMMEKHAANLQDSVNEQTQQIISEKQKTDRSLYRILPE